MHCHNTFRHIFLKDKIKLKWTIDIFFNLWGVRKPKIALWAALGLLFNRMQFFLHSGSQFVALWISICCTLDLNLLHSEGKSMSKRILTLLILTALHWICYSLSRICWLRWIKESCIYNLDWLFRLINWSIVTDSTKPHAWLVTTLQYKTDSERFWLRRGRTEDGIVDWMLHKFICCVCASHYCSSVAMWFW